VQPHKPSAAKLVRSADVAAHPLGQHEGVRDIRERRRCLCGATKFHCEYGALNTEAVQIRAAAGEFTPRSLTNAPGMIIPGAVFIGG
jgi:hypothetical protein